MVEPYRRILSKKCLDFGSEKQEIIQKKYVWKAWKLQKIRIRTKKIWYGILWRMSIMSHKCESERIHIFAAEKANSVVVM